MIRSQSRIMALQLQTLTSEDRWQSQPLNLLDAGGARRVPRLAETVEREHNGEGARPEKKKSREGARRPPPAHS